MMNSNKILITGALVINGVLLLILLFFDISSKGNFIYPALLIVDSLIAVYVYRDNKAIFLMNIFIAYVNYSIAMGIYMYPEYAPDFYNQITNDSIYIMGIISIIIFTCIILVPCLIQKQKICDNQMKHDNPLICYSTPIEFVCFVLYIYLFVTQTEWNVGERMSATALGEYKFFFAIMGSLYARKTNLHRYIWSSILLISSLIGFAGGNRVDSFPMIFILLLIWYPNISLKKLAIFGIPGIIVLKLIGEVRGDISLLINFDLPTIIGRVFDDFLIQDTFTYAYFPSLAAIDLSNIQDVSTKFDLFIKNIIYIFAGGEYGEYSLSSYTFNYYVHCYGFIGPLYLNYWFGVFGAILTGIIVAFIIKRFRFCNISSLSVSLEKAIFLCFVCIAPRWYVYNFFSIFRSILLFVIMYCLFAFFNRLLSGNNRKMTT